VSAVVLTGGIASGKTTVARLLTGYSIAVLDTDAVAAALSGPRGEAIPALREAFGPDALTPEGGLDRAQMRERAFSDPAVRAGLERILHPLIREEVEAFLSAHESGRCAVAIPLYFESLGYRGRFQQVVSVDCPTHVQKERLVRDRNMAPELATSILGAQIPRRIRLQLADKVLCNNTNLDDLTLQVEDWAKEWS
jgi:dephospho-CoA kinase